MNQTTMQFLQWCRRAAPALIAFALIAAASPRLAAQTAPGGSAASAPAPTAAASAAVQKKAAPAAPERLVDINSASRAELKTLPGIGDAEASKIIANRPYLTKTELVTKNVLATGPYVALKNRIVAMQKGPPPKPKS